MEAAVDGLCSHDLARSPEGVAIWLAAKEKFPKATFPSKVWKHDDPLDVKEQKTLTKTMKESSGEEVQGENKGSSKSSGVWNSKLHFAWDAVLSRTSDGNAKSKSKSSRLTFADFWTEVVDSKFGILNWCRITKLMAIYRWPFRFRVLR